MSALRDTYFLDVVDTFGDSPDVLVVGTDLNNFTGEHSGAASFTLAHDIVEHVNGLDKIGTVEDELMALGAVWVTRGQWGGISQNRHITATPYEQIATDVYEMFEHSDYVPLAKFEGIPAQSGHWEDLEVICEHARTHGATGEWIAKAMLWLEAGAAAQESRFEGTTAHDTFWSIENAIAGAWSDMASMGAGVRWCLTEINGEWECKPLADMPE